MRLNPYKGKFFVFEGIEGSGKTTQTKLLAEHMRRTSYSVHTTKEPTDTFLFGKLARFIYMCESLYEKLPLELAKCVGEREYQLMRAMAEEAKRRHIDHFEDIIREISEGNHTNLIHLVQLAMTFDRHDHITKEVGPNIQKGLHEISDRYFLSTPAYAAADGVDWRPFLDMQFEIVGEELMAPDLIIFMDVPVSVGLTRTLKKQQGRREFFDSEERMTKIQRTYYKLFQDKRMKSIATAYIDGALEPEVVHQKIWERVEPLLI